MAEEAEDAGAEAPVTDTPLAAEADQGSGDQGGSQTPSDIDALASEMGWAPKDQWRGNPDDWKDAKAFLKTTVEINRTLSKDVRELKQTTARMAKTSAAMMERALAEQREDLEHRYAAAVAANDPKAARQVQRALDQLDDPGEATDYMADFVARNPWYTKDEDAAAYAFAVCERNKTKPAEEQLRLAEEAVKKRFPEHFPEGKKPQPAVNDPGSRISERPKGKTFADLPRDAQAACVQFEKKGVKRADYVKSYFEENA
jgi:hypothetical protein